MNKDNSSNFIFNKQHIISIIENKSNVVGLAIYNMTSGEITISQIFDRMTYCSTISTLNAFSPLEILVSKTLQGSILHKNLKNFF